MNPNRAVYFSTNRLTPFFRRRVRFNTARATAEDVAVDDIVRSIGLTPSLTDDDISIDHRDPEIYAVDDDGKVPFGVSQSRDEEEEAELRFRQHPVVQLSCTDESFDPAPEAMLDAAARILADAPSLSKREAFNQKENWMNNVHNKFLNPSNLYDRNRSFEYLRNDHFMSHAVIRRVLREVRKRVSGLDVTNALDFGAGTGAGAWALSEVFGPSLQNILCVETAPFMRSIAEYQSKDITGSLPASKLDICWTATLPLERLDQYSITMAAFVMQEVHPSNRQNILEHLWACTAPGGVLVVLELGNAQGSASILDSRSRILAMPAARVLAPCPHAQECPFASKYAKLTETTNKRKQRQRASGRNFCHYGQRVMIESFPIGSLIRRRPQTASRLRFQNEHLVPFSYVVMQKYDPDAAKTSLEFDPSSWARMIKPPIKRGGHVILDLCQSNGSIERQVVSRSKGSGGPYKLARLSRWSDLWPYTLAPETETNNV